MLLPGLTGDVVRLKVSKIMYTHDFNEISCCNDMVVDDAQRGFIILID